MLERMFGKPIKTYPYWIIKARTIRSNQAPVEGYPLMDSLADPIRIRAVRPAHRDRDYTLREVVDTGATNTTDKEVWKNTLA